MAKVNVTVSVEPITVNAFAINGGFRTHNCEVGEWWGNNRCRKLDLDDIFSDEELENLPNGEYEIQILIKQRND